ncbi:flavin monoamine oxidase family protein [Staphylospora marina]|uniref:flavin monoamine oxidase family protein n=1 Tax=Staphylospora marina TaxID=2490858 RepID=UPI000F5C2493|nr:flavin monoamine oxidase family protein [Staphylospora marina]
MAELSIEQMVSIVREGLGMATSPEKVVIVGAGMAGLTAGSLLKQAGYRVVILEASCRIGGRVYTIRRPFSPGQFFEAGAMRIPSTHKLIREYIRKFGLSLKPFINSTPEDRIYVNGVKVRRKDYEGNPDILRYPVAPNERGKTAEELVRNIIRQVNDLYHRTRPELRPELTRRLESLPFDSFLKDNPYGIELSTGAVDMVRVLLDVQGLAELSFLDNIRILSQFLDPTISYDFIEGGMDRLPRSMYKEVQELVRFREKLFHIASHGEEVTLYTENTRTGAVSSWTGDYVIIAIPFSMLRSVTVEPYDAFSYYKRKAIRTLHYVPATKVGIEFKTRFWEREGMDGGQTVTDLPTRFTYYPSHGIGTPTPAVVLASYTWEDDTHPWNSQPEEERLRLALRNLHRIHGDVVYRDFVTGRSKSWIQDPFIGGGFVVFKPGQESELGPYIAVPEGRVHFAGEHTSTVRAWIEGAIQSGIRAAYEIHRASESDGQHPPSAG